MTIGNIISEPLEIYRKDIGKDIKTLKVLEVMEKVGLSDLLYNRFPHELSGGQCQRVGIARSIINEPDVLICDEPVSSLDLSVQSQILTLLKELKINLNITMIFVSHDLAVVKSISDEVMVLNQGLIVENNTADNVFSNPQNEYTRKLISSVPRINAIE
jgi:ATPase components of various ABC-type transport systems, contain duplicated ATPase